VRSITPSLRSLSLPQTTARQVSEFLFGGSAEILVKMDARMEDQK
jgi:hypothetical protein